MNWTLIAVLAVLLLTCFLGMHKGLIKMAYSLVIVLVVTIVTSIFAPKLAAYLKDNTTWDDALAKKTESFLEEKGILKEGVDIDVSELPIPFAVKDKIAQTAKEYTSSMAETYNEYVVRTVSSVIFSAIVYIVFFIIVLALAGIIGMLLDIISKLPVLKQVNKAAGAAIGLAEGLLIIWILAIFVMVFGNFEFAAYIHKDIDANGFLRFLYDKNLIMYLLTNFLG